MNLKFTFTIKMLWKLSIFEGPIFFINIMKFSHLNFLNLFFSSHFLWLEWSQITDVTFLLNLYLISMFLFYVELRFVFSVLLNHYSSPWFSRKST